MAGKDIRIKISPTVVEGKSGSELEKVINTLSKNAKKIDIGIDGKKLSEELTKLKKQVDELTNPKKKSSKTNTFKEETNSAKKLISEYKSLIQQKDKLEKQMSKSSFKGQAYKALAKDLDGVNKKIRDVGNQIDGLNKKNIKSDIASSLANSFESVVKQANTLGNALDNALKNKDYTGSQLTQLKKLKAELDNIKSSANLNNILKADKPYEEMSKLLTAVDNAQAKFAKLKITDSFVKSIKDAEGNVAKLQQKIKDLYTKGYGSTNEIDKLSEKAKKLSETKINFKDEDAKAKLKTFIADIDKLEAKYNELNSKMGVQVKRDTFNIDVSKTINDLEKLRTKYTELGKDTSSIDAVKSKLDGLNKLTFTEAQQQLTKYKEEINKLSTDIPKATSAMTSFNRLMRERASLEKQMSKTTDSQAYDVLKTKLQENLAQIEKLSTSMDVLKNKKIDPDITKSLASTFNNLQQQITKTSQTLDNMFKNKNLTTEQVTQLKQLQNQLIQIKGTKLDDILKSDKSYESMSKLLTALQNINTASKEMSINTNFNAQIDSAYKQIEKLKTNISDLKNVKGFLNTSELQNRLTSLTDFFDTHLRNAKINIDSDTAVADLRILKEYIEVVENELNELNSISNNAKKSFDFSTSINASKSNLNNLITALKNLGQSTTDAERLKTQLDGLSKIPLEQAESELKRINQEISSIGKTEGIEKAKQSLKQYVQLAREKSSLETQMTKVNINTEAYSVLNSQLEQINSKIKTIESSFKNLSTPEQATASILAYSKAFSKIETQIGGLESKMKELNGSLNSLYTANVFNTLENKLNKLKNVNLADILKADKPYEELAKLIEELSQFESKVKKLEGEIAIGEKFKSEFSTAKEKVQELSNALNNFKVTKSFGNTAKLDELQSKLERLKNTNININDSDAEAKLKQLIADINTCEKEFKELQGQAKIDGKQFNIDTSVRNTIARLDELERKMKSVGQSTTEVGKLRTQLQGLGNVSFKEADSQLRSINSRISQLSKGCQTATNSSKKMANGLVNASNQANRFVNNLYSTLSTYSLGNIIGIQITKGIYAIKQTIVDLDSAFRDMEKVAPASFTSTKEEFQQVKEMAYATSQEVARSSVDIINSTASAFQLGIDNVKDAMEYAKQVNMYANVADISEEDADKYVKSIASAYGGVTNSLKPMTNAVKGASASYSLLNDYMDQANYAGNNFAVTSADVGEALQRSASALKANGNSMQENIGMIVGANEIVQDASRVGNALKSIAVNLNGVTYSAKIGAMTTNKTAKALRDIAKINVVDESKGTVKDGFDVLDELAKKWDTLKETEQKTITEAIGNKYHANTLQAMLDNWETVLQYQEEYNEGFTVGSANKENERYINSIEGKVTKLNDQFRNLVTTTISSDMVKGMVDGLAGGLEGINNVLAGLDKIGMATPVAIASIMTLFNTIKSKATGQEMALFGSKFIANARKSQTEVSVISNNIRNASSKTKNALTKDSNVLATNIQTNTARITKGLGASGKSFQVFSRDATGNLQRVTKVSERATITATSVKNSFIKTAGSMAVSTVKSSLASVGIAMLNGAMLTLAITIVSKVITALDDYIHKTEKAYEASTKAMDVTKNNISNLNSQKTNLKQLADGYEELSNKANLTKDEMSQLSDYKNQLAEMFPELVTGYDENNDPILAMGKNTDDLIEKLDMAIAKERDLYDKQLAKQAREAGKLAKNKRNNNTNADGIYDSARANELKAFENKGYLQVLDKYNKKAKDTTDQIYALNEQMQKNFTEYSEYEASQQASAKQWLQENNKYFSLLGDDQLASMNNIMNAYDWSNELVAENETKRREVLKGFDTLSAWAVDNYDEIDKFTETFNKANEAFQQTGDMLNYQKAIKGVCDQLEAITGISASEWATGFTQQLEGRLDETQMALNNFLKGFDLSLMDLDFGDNQELANQLKVQFESLQGFVDDLTSQDIDAKEKINLLTEIVQGDTAYKDLPPQIQALVEGAMDNGKSSKDLSTDELLVTMRLATVFENYGTFGSDSSIITKMLNGELTDDEVANLEVGIKLPDGSVIEKDIVDMVNKTNRNKGDKNIKVDLDAEDATTKLEQLKEKIESFDKISKRDDVKMLFTTNVIGEDKLELVEETMDKLPIDKDNTIKIITDVGSAFNQLEDYNDLIAYLLEHPSIATNVGLKVTKEETIEAVKKSIDDLLKTDKEKEIEVKINKGVVEGDISKIRNAIKELPETKQVKVATEISEALEGLNTVDAIEIREKIIKTFLEDDETQEKLDYLESQTNKKDYKSVMFQTEGYEDTNLKLITVDSKGNPVPKIVQMSTEGFEGTIQKEDTVTQKAKGEKKVVKISSDGYETTIQQEDTVTQKAKSETKPVTIQTEGYQITIQQEDTVTEKAKDETKTVTFTAIVSEKLESWFNKLNSFVGGATVKVNGANGAGHSSTEGFKNISDTPMEVNSPMAMSEGDVSVMSSADGEVADVSATALKDFGAIGVTASKSTSIEVSFDRIIYSLENSIKMFQEMENRISRCTNQLNLLGKQMERSVGTNRIAYLEKQNALYKEQTNLQKQYYDLLIQEKLAVRDKLTNTYGFNVNAQGNLVNYDERFIAMQKEYDRLEKAYENAQDAEKKYNDTVSKSNKSSSSSSKKKTKKQLEAEQKAQDAKEKAQQAQKDKLSKATENAQKKLDDYKEKFDKVKQLSSDYIELQYTELPKIEEEWQDLQNSIAENNDEIEKLLREDRLYKFKNSVGELNNQFRILNNTLDLLDAKLEYANGADQISLYEKKIDAIEKQRDALKDMISQYEEMAKVYKEDLSTYGFMFDELGNVTNYDEVLNAHQNEEDLEKINDLLEEFLDLQNDELPDAQKQWVELSNTIKDLQKEKLNKIQDIESKITEIYKDEIDKRKDAIQKQYDDTIDKINKQKEAYEDKKSEDDYNKNLTDQQQKIAEIQSKIDKYSRDDSMSSKAKISELLDELAEEKENLDNLIKDREDELIGKMFDGEVDKLQEESDKAIKDLEDKWNDKKIFEMAQQALQNGVFTDIDGNILNLQDTLISFAEQSGDALGVMADIVKNDLVENLGVALEYVKEYSDIIDSLSLKQYGGIGYGDSNKLAGTKNTTIGDITINVNGASNPVDTSKEIENKLLDIINRI